jgi:hypothetical protein
VDQADRDNSEFFIKHKRELTTLPVLRYSSGNRKGRKGRLKILSMNTAVMMHLCNETSPGLGFVVVERRYLPAFRAELENHPETDWKPI